MIEAATAKFTTIPNAPVATCWISHRLGLSDVVRMYLTKKSRIKVRNSNIFNCGDSAVKLLNRHHLLWLTLLCSFLQGRSFQYLFLRFLPVANIVRQSCSLCKCCRACTIQSTFSSKWTRPPTLPPLQQVPAKSRPSLQSSLRKLLFGEIAQYCSLRQRTSRRWKTESRLSRWFSADAIQSIFAGCKSSNSRKGHLHYPSQRKRYTYVHCSLLRRIALRTQGW